MISKKQRYSHSNVLLIDDNELDNFINRKILEANHFSKNIHSLTSGVCALSYLGDTGAMGKGPLKNYPEVIFIDIMMPIIDGFEFIERLGKMPHIKRLNPLLVILTSSINPADRQKALAMSADILFLDKPLTKEMLENIDNLRIESGLTDY